MEEFTCYFCKKKIKNDTQLGHLSMCANVLEPCPNKCGSYVSRMDLKRHRNECLNRRTTTIPPSKDTSSLYLNRNNVNYKRLQEQIEYIKQYLTSLEKLEVSQKMFEIQVEQLKQSIGNLEKSKEEHYYHWQNFQKQITIVDQITLDMKQLMKNNKKTKETNDKIFLELAKSLENLKDEFKLENAQIAELWTDHNREIEKILTDLSKIHTNMEEQKIKTASILFDVKTCNRIVEESVEKIEILERDSQRINKEIMEFRSDLEAIEGDLAKRDALNVGELIWIISGFKEKLEKAKQDDSVLKSPIFYTKKYGYKIRILLYLNGLKKWKNRYALLSIHVLKGEYDLLQTWPCSISGSITLKDLENVKDPKDKTKFITAKRQFGGDEENEEPQECSSSYIFLPHLTLMNERYLKKDTVIFYFKSDDFKTLQISNL